MIVVCFDPDADPPAAEIDFFDETFASARKDAVGELAREEGGRSFLVGDRTVSLLFAPWRHDGPVSFASLPDEQNLERLLITGILRAQAAIPLGPWAETATSSLPTLVDKHGWKRAFRIWNAALEPKSEAFVDALLQHAPTKTACLDALRESKAWQTIARLHTPADPPAPSPTP